MLLITHENQLPENQWKSVAKSVAFYGNQKKYSAWYSLKFVEICLVDKNIILFCRWPMYSIIINSMVLAHSIITMKKNKI